MATHGQRQLLRLTLSYCEKGGSSRNIRDLFQSRAIVEFAEKHPDLEIKTQVRNGKHPYVKGDYRTGWDKVIGVKNMSPDKVIKYCEMLNNSSGRKLKAFTKNVYSEKPSVQGIWTPGIQEIRNATFAMKIVK